MMKWQMDFSEYAPDPKTVCAFCKGSFAAEHLIRGPNGLNICLNCVSLCTEIAAEREAKFREDAVKEMLAIEQVLGDGYQPDTLMYQLYDAGYRKATTSCQPCADYQNRSW